MTPIRRLRRRRHLSIQSSTRPRSCGACRRSWVIGPVALLVFFQLQFLPYHEPWITWWQRIAIVVDLALLWTLWPAVGLREVVSMEKGEARRRGLVEVTRRLGTIV